MGVLLTKDSQFVYIILIAIGLLVLMVIAIVVFFYFSRKKIIKAELENANLVIEHQRDVLQSTILVQEAERKRIAQDMHDAISSKLNIVSLNANFLTEENITKEEMQTYGESILKVTTDVLESSRRIAHDLLPPTLQGFGLKAALEELCEEAGVSEKFKIKHNLNYQTNHLSEDEELQLFRIVQELLSNTIKYAEASEIYLELQNDENVVSLKYKDNGKGFDPSNIKLVKGIGMSGIYNRVAILEGTISIDSSLGNGIDVTLKVDKS